MLSIKEIALIKSSWNSLGKIDAVTFGDIFYTRLFYNSPELRKIFPANIEVQYKKLKDMLDIIIARLEKLDDLKGEIVQMARRHVNYGVKQEHYNIVGKTLLWTLQKILAKEWTDELKSAWINCYAILSGTMITAAAK